VAISTGDSAGELSGENAGVSPDGATLGNVLGYPTWPGGAKSGIGTALLGKAAGALDSGAVNGGEIGT
jgi:hypothetical protein